MKFKKNIIFIVLLHLTANIYANEIPNLLLNEGINEIALSVINNGNNDLINVTIKVDRDKLPSWLTINETNQIIDVPKRGHCLDKIYLTFEVINAPAGAYCEIPYTLKDSKGNEWNFLVMVQLDSDKKTIPKAFNELYENFPNPFNPITTINYSLKEEGTAFLVIYNSLGQEIRTLVNDTQNAGIHTVQWDGCNNNGQKVSSGLYLYKLKTGSFVKTRRMMLVE